MKSNIPDVGLVERMSDIEQALLIERRRLDRRHARLRYGPRVTRIELVRVPYKPGDTAVFEVDILESGVTRGTKLRFEMTDHRRNSTEQFRGKRDLSLMVIFIRIRDKFGQIMNRISKRIGLLISDIRRQIDFLRHGGRNGLAPDESTRKWRRKRRHWCHRPSFLPAPAGAW